FLIDRLVSEHQPISVRCLHNDLPLGDKRFSLVKQAKWHRLDLRPDLEKLWKAMHDSTHRAIRKSEREELSVRTAQSEQELRAFFEMHLKVRKYKYGLLAQPYSFRSSSKKARSSCSDCAVRTLSSSRSDFRMARRAQSSHSAVRAGTARHLRDAPESAQIQVWFAGATLQFPAKYLAPFCGA